MASKRRQAGWGAAMAGVALFLLSCFVLLTADNPPAGPPFKVGVSLPLSGPKQANGEAILNALRLAVESRRAAGDRVELVVLDDANVPEKARANAEALAKDSGVVAVIGHYDDAPAAAAGEIYHKAGLPAFMPSVGNAKIVSSSPWLFSGTYSEKSEAETMAAYLSALKGMKSAVVFHGDDLYGRDSAAAFAAKAKALGAQVTEIEYAEGTELPADFAAKRRAAVAGKDAAVLFSHSVQGARLIKQLRAAGLDIDVYGASRLGTGLIEKLGDDVDDVHVAFPFLFELASITTHEFEQAYRKKFGAAPSIFGAFAYDGLGMIAGAVRASGADRKAVREALAGYSSGDQAYDGASGRLHFDRDTAMDRDVVMATIYNGRFSPSFSQLRAVRTKHALEVVPQGLKKGEMVMAGGKPYFKVQVVYAGVDFSKVSNADFKSPTYDLEFFLWLKWRDQLDPEQLIFLNEAEVTRTELRKNHGAEGEKDPKVKWIAYKVKGSFTADYDLRLFPFDRQSLDLALVHRSRNANKIMLVADRTQHSEAALKSIPQDWRYEGRDDYAGTFNYDSTFGNPSYKAGERQSDYSVFHADLKLKRVLFPYLITLFLPMAVLTLISFGTLFVPIADFSSRVTFTLTSLLGVLVEHMTQARSMPSEGYLLRADWYFVAAYVLFFVLVAEISFINVLVHREKAELAERLDRPFRTLFIVLTLGTYAAITISAVCAAG